MDNKPTTDPFQGVPIKELISGPLVAACDAQVALAQSTVDFTKTVTEKIKPIEDTEKSK